MGGNCAIRVIVIWVWVYFRVQCHNTRRFVPFENKGAVQLFNYCTANLRLCFAKAKIRFSHDAAHIKLMYRR